MSAIDALLNAAIAEAATKNEKPGDDARAAKIDASFKMAARVSSLAQENLDMSVKQFASLWLGALGVTGNKRLGDEFAKAMRMLGVPAVSPFLVPLRSEMKAQEPAKPAEPPAEVKAKRK